MTRVPNPLRRGGVALLADDAGGGGQPVVFQHGLCGDAGQTTEAFPPDPAFRRLTLECRGHGRSETGPTDLLRIATFADDVAALIAALGPPVVMGGISMGAAIALRLAVRRPDLVRGLVLARPDMAPNAEVGRLLANGPQEAARAAFLAGPTAARLAADAPDNLASLTGFFARTPLDVTAMLLQAISADGPGVTEAEVRAISVPALVLGTDRDAIHPFAHAQTLAGLIRGARLLAITSKAVDRAAYLHEFRAALAAFLKDIP
jgi:pimeloyl-ACP methyl ester carboxylesterase